MVLTGIYLVGFLTGIPLGMYVGMWYWNRHHRGYYRNDYDPIRDRGEYAEAPRYDATTHAEE
jgi:hypothetical protein